MNVATLWGQDAEVVCVCCGCSGHLTIDHQVPRCMGGTNARTNLAPLCYACNQTKGRLEAEFATRWRQAKPRKQAAILGEFMARWRHYCRSHEHGDGLIHCRCNGCLHAALLA